MKISKKLLALIILISGIIGFLVVLPVHYALEETSTDKFCVVCHEMDPMVIAYNDDVHSGKGPTGVKAKCVDCHIPHDNIAKYVLIKAKNGVMEGWVHFFGDPNAIDWHKNLKNREHFVFDNGCTSCHANVITSDKTSAQAQKMHAHYEKLKGTDKELKCVSCHFSAGHSVGFRNYLEYWKPTYSIYDKKMMEKKIEIKKAFFKDKYTPTKEEEEFMKGDGNKTAGGH